DDVLNRTFDLFMELGATDEQADFPVIYACATKGLAGLEPELENMTSVLPVLDVVLEKVPPPVGHIDRPLQMLTLSLAYDDYRGRMAIGRISNGTLRRNQMITHIDREGNQKKVRVADIYTYEGLARTPCEEATAGDIVAIAGLPFVHIGETIADAEEPEAIPTIAIDEPVVKMTFAVNTSPFSGNEGDYSTSRHLRERLMRELETDVALRVEDTDSPDRLEVSGRGELHLAILIEKMRREGYELQAGRPQVIFKEIDGKRHEPTEVVYIEVPEEFSGAVIEKMNQRRGEMLDMKPEGKNIHLEYLIPTRGLIGYRSEFLTDTKGMGTLHSINAGYEPYAGDLSSPPRGFLVSWEQGTSNSYAIQNAEERGVLFVGPGVPVYEGMIVGLNSRPEDMDFNICKSKKLTNMRSSTSDIKVALTPPRILTLEQAIEIIGDDELVEVTPKSIRLRKTILGLHDRRRSKAQAAR
ncbi:MAG TPA: EF-Tu/IF-2/RF-3 family GTPase, partial [Armatimonadota bacterium]